MLSPRRLTGIRALVGLSLLSLFLFAGGLTVLAGRVDRQLAAHETRVVQADYEQALDQCLAVVDSNALWDGLVERLDKGVDGPWLDDNLGTTSGWSLFGAHVLIADPDDRIVYAIYRDHASPPAVRASLQAVTAPALASFRKVEDARIAQRLRAADPAGPQSDVIHFASAARMDGEVQLVLASRIDSPANRRFRLRRRAPVMLVVAPMQNFVTQSLAAHLELLHPRLLPVWPAPAKPAIPLLDGAGQPVAALSWVPRTPGSDLLDGALPALALTVFLLGTGILVAYRQSLGSARALAESEKHALDLAYHDQLTELPNRRFILERMEGALAEAGHCGRDVAIILFDLDRFKAVNDTYGHGAGDELLKEVARRLRVICGSDDIVCARLSGDEFLVLMQGTVLPQASAMAGRISASIAEPVVLTNATVQVGASAGIAFTAGEDVSPSEMMRRADLALYNAKAKEPGFASIFSQEMDGATKNRLRLEQDLRLAIATGQVKVVYQPQFRDGVIRGAEVLARWRHPVHGDIPPDRFIAVAEDCGVIDQLGFHVMALAFEDSRRLPGLRIAINVSGRQLLSRHFLPRLQALVADMAVDPERFEIELTETILLQQDRRVRDTLFSLKAMGFVLALDDFGTGYASISYLRHLPLDKIKIDRAFIEPLPNDQRAAGLVLAMVRLANALGIEVLAEGVETEDQLRCLAELGCTDIQGYLMERPISVEQLEAMLELTLAA